MSVPVQARHIGVAGAGLLGRLLAWRLASQGHQVTVFDPATGPLDRGSSDAASPPAAGWTAAGMLSPWAELESSNQDVARLGVRSLDLWEHLLKELPQPVYFSRRGSLLLAHRSDLGAAQRTLAVLQSKTSADQAPRPLTLEELRALEPAVHGPTHAWMMAGEGSIHTVQAMQALADGATARGVQWCWGERVDRVGPGHVDGLRFDWVFDVRGVGAGVMRSASPTAEGPAVRGVRGEILWLHAPGVVLNRPMRLLHPRWRVYLVPRPGDVIVVGASEIESEDRSPISVRSLIGLLTAAHSVVPELAEARVIHTETNLRPALPDNLPLLDVQPGLTRINGLFRHGWLIAPALVEDALQHPDFLKADPVSVPAQAE